MSRIFISVIHATKGRPEKAIATMKYWLEKARHPQSIEYILVVNRSEGVGPYYDVPGFDIAPGWGIFYILPADVQYSAPAWNVGAAASNGELLVQGQDDVFPPQNWDHELCWTAEANDAWQNPAVIQVGDGYRKGPASDLMCTAICNRAWYNREGHFIYPQYRSMFSDDDFTIRAKAAALDGECILIDRRDMVVFRHENPIHNPNVPVDETHRHENSDEAYAIGGRLFYLRNAELIRRGLKTW